MSIAGEIAAPFGQYPLLLFLFLDSLVVDRMRMD